jgi:hypothetical protein
MPIEHRIRVTLILPTPTTSTQHLLVTDILTNLVQVCGGVTVSSRLLTGFEGLWFDPDDQQIKGDQNILVLADAPIVPNLSALNAYLDVLKTRAQHEFRQDIIWVTMHPVDRIDTNDYVR